MDRFEKIASKVAGVKVARANWMCNMWMPAGGTYCQGYFWTTYLGGDGYLSDLVYNLMQYDGELKKLVGRVRINHGSYETRVELNNGAHKLSTVIQFTLPGEGNNEAFEDIISRLNGAGINVMDVKRTSTKPQGM